MAKVERLKERARAKGSERLVTKAEKRRAKELARHQKKMARLNR